MNKKLLKTSVIASVMAMAFTASAWASNYSTISLSNLENQIHSSVTWDGAYFNQQSGFPDLFGTASLMNPNNGTKVEGTGYYKFNYGGGVVYGTQVEGNWVYNFNAFSPDNLPNNVSLPPAQYPTTWNSDWDKVTQIYTMDYAATMAAFEAERRIVADNKLHLDDVKDITHTLSNGILTTAVVGNDGNTISSATVNLSGAFIDNDTKLESSTTGLGFTSDGKLSLKVVDEAGRTVTGVADIGKYVKENAGNAIYSGSTTINQQITKNKTDIANNTTKINNNTQTINEHTTQITTNTTNIQNNTDEITKIKNNNVTNITKEVTNDDRDIWNVTQIIGGVETPVQITDEHINSYTMSINGDKLESKITTNFGIPYEQSVRVGDATINYAGDIIVQNPDGSTTQVTETIENAINNNYTKIVNVENNNVSYISDRKKDVNNNFEYYEVTQKIDGQDVPVKIKDTTLIPKAALSGLRLIDVFKNDVNIQDDNDPEVQAMRAYIEKNALVERVDPVSGMPQIMMEFEDTNGNVVQGALDIGSMIANATDIGSPDNNIVITDNDSALGFDLALADDVRINKSITVNNLVKINENGKITNVTDGEVSETSKDAINGSQLYAEQQARIEGDSMINNRIDKLGNRVDKVGAGAAALAALHPMDFDPDDKLQFSAGVGNYGGETATALGAFYRPTEKVMFSVAGTMGNGENMVNAGITFALDRKNNVSNSRVAMAREIQDLRDQVAQLTALVTQLAGRSNPALLDTVMFPDVPENHWAYDYIDSLQKRGIIEGYPDGNYGGDRSCTRYEYAAMLYRALEKGFPVDSRLLDEFKAELGRIRVDRIKGADDDANKVERVRVNDYEGRDDYGSKLAQVVANAAPSIEEPAA